jgi:hypothetical protein
MRDSKGQPGAEIRAGLAYPTLSPGSMMLWKWVLQQGSTPGGSQTVTEPASLDRDQGEAEGSSTEREFAFLFPRTFQV